MKLIITQPEIEEIVRAHVLNTVQLRDGSEVKIDFTATRGEDGIVATIDIPYMGVSSIPEINAAGEQAEAVNVTVTAQRRGRPKAAAVQAPKANLLAAIGSPEEPQEEPQELPADPLDEPTAQPEAEELPVAAEQTTSAPARGPSLFASNFLGG